MAQDVPVDWSDYFASKPCRRCGGSGLLARFSHVHKGVCFLCGGSGCTWTGRDTASRISELTAAWNRLTLVRGEDVRPGDVVSNGDCSIAPDGTKTLLNPWGTVERVEATDEVGASVGSGENRVNILRTRVYFTDGRELSGIGFTRQPSENEREAWLAQLPSRITTAKEA